jgi:proteic killer suppression protein
LLRIAQQANLPSVIRSIPHKDLRRFFENGNSSGVKAGHRRKLRLQLTALDTALTIEDMDIPGFRLHSLKGKRSGIRAVDVSGNWRLTFRSDNGHAYDLDYEDHH